MGNLRIGDMPSDQPLSGAALANNALTASEFGQTLRAGMPKIHSQSARVAAEATVTGTAWNTRASTTFNITQGQKYNFQCYFPEIRHETSGGVQTRLRMVTSASVQVFAHVCSTMRLLGSQSISIQAAMPIDVWWTADRTATVTLYAEVQCMTGGSCTVRADTASTGNFLQYQLTVLTEYPAAV